MNRGQLLFLYGEVKGKNFHEFQIIEINNGWRAEMVYW